MTLTPLSPDATQSIRGYLEAVVKAQRTFLPRPGARPYLSIEDFVLQHGQPSAERVANPEGMWPGLFRSCFFNAATLACAFPERYTYVEGFALGILPVQHAWVRDAQGRVLDITWPEEAEEGSPPAYYGVAFQTEYIRPIYRLRWECALDNWKERHPLLTGAHGLDTALQLDTEVTA